MVSVKRTPDFVRIITESDNTLMEKTNSGFKFNDAVLTCNEKASELEILLTADKTPIKFIACRWNGRMDKDRHYYGDELERGYGNLTWNTLNSNRIMNWYFMASDNKNNNGYGVKVNPDAICFWMCDAQGATLWMDVRSYAAGVILEGRKINPATVVELEENGITAFRFAKKFTALMADGKGIFPDHPVYGSNNWYYAYGDSSEEQVLKDTKLIAELTEGLKDRPYMVIDDCWQIFTPAFGAAGRPYDGSNNRFPDMAGLCKKMKSMDVHTGLWFRPLRDHDKFISKELRHPEKRDVLDPSMPEVMEMIASDVKRFVNEWGFELLKYDFAEADMCGDFGMDKLKVLQNGSGKSFHNRSITTAECAKNLYSTIHKAAGKAVLIGCNVIGHLAVGEIHIHRSGDDTSGRSFDRTIFMGVNTLASRLCQSETFFEADADCVGITHSIAWEDNKKMLDLFAKSGTALFVSPDPEAVDEQVKKDLKEAFKISLQKHDMEPVDWLKTNIPEDYIVDGKEIHYEWIREEGLKGFNCYQ